MTPQEKGLELKTMVFNVNRLSTMITDLSDTFDITKESELPMTKEELILKD